VLVFFADAFGVRDVYNRPGTTGDQNWTLRLTPDYRERYRALRQANQALNLPRALAMAMRARCPDAGAVIDRLEQTGGVAPK
jgi:hypothetical protein